MWDFIRDHDGEFKKSDIPKAMAGRAVTLKPEYMAAAFIPT